MSSKVAIITYQFSVVVKSMERGLTEQDYTVSLMDDNIDELKKALRLNEVFIIYLQEVILDDMDKVKRLFLICDIFKEARRSPILVGSVNEKDSFLKGIPGFKDFPWVDRPVDMYRLRDVIDMEAKKLKESKVRKKILVIDDDFAYGMLVNEWLKSTYEVEIVTNGMDGISWLTNNHADLILLDFEMPILDGPKMLEMLRANSATSSVAVIFLTGNGTKESISRVMGLKPQGYLLKTTTKKDLLLKLKSFFDSQDMNKRTGVF